MFLWHLFRERADTLADNSVDFLSGFRGLDCRRRFFAKLHSNELSNFREFDEMKPSERMVFVKRIIPRMYENCERRLNYSEKIPPLELRPASGCPNKRFGATLLWRRGGE